MHIKLKLLFAAISIAFIPNTALAQGGPPPGGGGGGPATTLSSLGCGPAEIARVNGADEWECSADLTANEAAAVAAQTTADTAVGNAATAQSTANTAVENAATAQSTADTALSDAATALSGVVALDAATTLADLSCSTDQIARWNGSQWVCSTDISAVQCGPSEVLTGDDECINLQEIGAGGAVIFPPKVVFITSTLTTGNITFPNVVSGVDAADAICQDLADKSLFTPIGKYVAWLSDSFHSPAESFKRSRGPYVMVDGTLIASNWEDLTDGSIATPINLTEDGEIASFVVQRIVWTGTSPSGERAITTDTYCNDWTTNAVGFSDTGRGTLSNGGWTDEGGPDSFESACFADRHLYCFQQ